MQIAVCNGTDHDIVLNGRTTLGVLQAVKSVTEADVRLSGCRTSSEDQHLEQHESQESTTLNIPGKQDRQGINPLPAVDLSGLNHDQQILAETMLSEDCELFSSSEQDIGCIPDLEKEIYLKDSQPVQKKYTSIPRPLYPEVKQYIEDLLKQNFVKESKSQYSSPVVCARKKDGS